MKIQHVEKRLKMTKNWYGVIPKLYYWVKISKEHILGGVHKGRTSGMAKWWARQIDRPAWERFRMFVGKISTTDFIDMTMVNL